MDEQIERCPETLCELQEPDVADGGRQETSEISRLVLNPYGYVYVLYGRVRGDLIFAKIGKATMFYDRLGQIFKSYQKVQPVLPFTIEEGLIFECWLGNETHVEKWLHEYFSRDRLRGEWFMWSHNMEAFLYHNPLPMPFPVRHAARRCLCCGVLEKGYRLPPEGDDIHDFYDPKGRGCLA